MQGTKITQIWTGLRMSPLKDTENVNTGRRNTTNKQINKWSTFPSCSLTYKKSSLDSFDPQALTPGNKEGEGREREKTPTK